MGRGRSRSRILRQIDLPHLIELAQRADAIIRLRIMPGDLVRENAVVFEIWGATDTPDAATLRRCLEVGIDRNLTQDPLLGFRAHRAPAITGEQSGRPRHHERPDRRQPLTRAGNGGACPTHIV